MRGAMAAILAEPKAAFVQTRIEWGNGERNWLTRAQRLMQDAHFAVEQDVRARRGVPFQFNGTGGIWRRAAVDEAGGLVARSPSAGPGRLVRPPPTCGRCGVR